MKSGYGENVIEGFYLEGGDRVIEECKVEDF